MISLRILITCLLGSVWISQEEVTCETLPGVKRLNTRLKSIKKDCHALHYRFNPLTHGCVNTRLKSIKKDCHALHYRFNPLTHGCDQYINSPYSVNILISRQVMRIRKIDKNSIS